MKLTLFSHGKRRGQLISDQQQTLVEAMDVVWSAPLGARGGLSFSFLTGDEEMNAYEEGIHGNPS